MVADVLLASGTASQGVNVCEIFEQKSILTDEAHSVTFVVEFSWYNEPGTHFRASQNDIKRE